jgi:alpha-ribazole phosphatase
MEIYLVRHTKTALPKTICYGQLDCDIETPYTEAFHAIQDQLPNKAIVYSSPLKRCKLLAEFLNIQFQTQINFDTRLQEMNFGDWEGKEWDAIDATELGRWMENFVTVTIPNGESMTDVYERVKLFYKTLSTNETLPIVIVAHAGVIRNFLCLVNNTALEKAFDYKVELGSVIKVVI